jgi:hypothetical protein
MPSSRLGGAGRLPAQRRDGDAPCARRERLGRSAAARKAGDRGLTHWDRESGDASGNVCFCGMSFSTNFPTAGGYSSVYAGGGGDGFVVRIAAAVPLAPTGLSAVLQGAATAHLTWNDNSGNELSFDVQRRVGTGSFTTYASLPAGATTYDDTSMFASSTYKYRVRTVGVEGPSAFTNEASVTAAGSADWPPLPRAPGGLEAIVVTANEVDLTWTDRSNDELGFEVQRADGGDVGASAGTTTQDTTAHADLAVPPGWPVTYRVRALAPQGPSTFCDPVTVTTPGAVTLATRKGLVTDSAKARNDKLTWSGTFDAGAPATVLDPRASGLRLQAGPPGAPVVVTIPPASLAWKVRKSKYTWKSAKDVVPAVSLVVDVVKKTVVLSAAGFDYAPAPTTAYRALIAFGEVAGGLSETWAAGRKAGTYVPPKP